MMNGGLLQITCFRRDDSKDMRIYYICDRSSHYRFREVDGEAKGVKRFSKCDKSCCRRSLEFPNHIEKTLLMLYYF